MENKTVLSVPLLKELLLWSSVDPMLSHHFHWFLTFPFLF